jgi:hypothetical protein
MNRPRRLITIALALVAASLLALAVQGGRWWTIGDSALGDVAIGPLAGSRCDTGECKRIGLGWLGGGEGWTRAGIATYTAGLLAALLLVISAALLAARKIVRPVAGSGLVAVVTAGIAGAAFFALFPGAAGTAVSRGAWLYAAGVLLAAAAHLSVLRARPAPPPATG